MPLVLGNGNQIESRSGKHYNVEEWDAKIELQCDSWTGGNRFVDVRIVKLYNVCTFYISTIKGDAGSPVPPPNRGLIRSVPSVDPTALTSGKIPNRFLPMNTQTDIDAGNNEGFHKTFLIAGIDGGAGFAHHFVIQHFPLGDPNFGENGKITIGFNASNTGFPHTDAGTDPTSIQYITNTNINIIN